MLANRLEFLTAIHANPEDDAPRLAFADWLERQGEGDFARLIRLELERDRLPKSDTRWEVLEEQIRELKKLKAWGSARVYVQTKRGFPFFIESGLLALQDAMDRIGPYAVEPFLLLHGNQQPDQDAEAEWLQGGPDRVGVALREIFASRWVRQWYELQLQDIRITEERARWMTEPGNLQGLTALSVTDGADDNAVRILCQAHLPRLNTFGLQELRRSCGEESLLTTASILALLDAPFLERLEGLLLVGHWLTDDGLQALAQCSRLTGLKSLFIWPQPNSQTGVKAILQSPQLAALTRLDLSGVPLAPEMVELLLRPDVLPGLRRLVIPFEGFTYRDLLQARFGVGVIVGSEEEP